jgi:nitrogen fixation protein
MDIVAERLSADTLKARNVTVGGQDVLAWFESKLSASVSFVGVFQSLDDAPPRNGAVAIVGSKDYIYSDPPGEWREFGDEGQIGALTQAVQALHDGLSAYATKGDLSSVVTEEDLSAYAKKEDLSAYAMEEDLSAYATKGSLSAYAVKDDLSSVATKDDLSAYATKEDLSAYATSLSGLSYDYDDELPWMARAIRDILSAFGGEVRNFPAG